MNFKRILAVVLACVMCLVVLASCNNGPQELVKPNGNQGMRMCDRNVGHGQRMED